MDLGERVKGLSLAKRQLLDLWLDDQADVGLTAPAYTAPRNVREEAMAAIWREVLEVERVGIDDDYFALGGDSITAIVIVARAARAGLHISAYELFELLTVRKVVEAARAVEKRPTVVPAPVASADVPDEGFPLGPLQQGMLYHAMGGSPAGAYLVQVSSVLVGDLDVEAFRAAWQAVLTANPAMRCCFVVAGQSLPRQAVREDLRVPLIVHDWRALAAEHRAAQLAEYLQADRNRGFELTAAPLLRLALIREDERRHRCVWTYHHLLFDGWSQQLVLRDVLELYRGLTTGSEAKPAHRPPFTDYVGQGHEPESADTEWVRQLAGRASPTRIAEGRAAGSDQPLRRAEAVLTVSEDLTSRLVELGREHGVTLGTIMHGGWALLLADRSGQHDVVFGSTMSGRSSTLPGITDSIGMFANTLPLSIGCPADAGLMAWLREVQIALLDLREHDQVSLSWIERAAGLPPGQPLFDSIVVVENFPTVVGEGDSGAGLWIEQPVVHIDEGYPVVVEVTPARFTVLRARYDPTRLSAPAMQAMLAALHLVLEIVADQPDVVLATVLARLARQRRDRDAHSLRTARRRPGGTDGRLTATGGMRT